VFKLAVLFGIVSFLTKKLKRPLRIMIFAVVICLLATQYFIVEFYPAIKPYYPVKGKIIFDSDRDIKREFYIFMLANKKIKPFIKNGVSPSFSPDGKKIAFIGLDDRLVATYDLQKNTIKNFKDTTTSKTCKLLWSLDSNSIYFIKIGGTKQGDSLNRINLITGEIEILIDHDKNIHIDSIGNYKDEKIFISSHTLSKDSNFIYSFIALSLKEKAIKKIVTLIPVLDFDISHDCKMIVFTSTKDPNGKPIRYTEIFTMNIDGTDIKRLTHNKWQERYPCWSPDDAQICFTGLRYYNSVCGGELYVMNADGTHERRITQVRKIGGFGYWSTDSKPDWCE
jgi:Tol biopolymer transport system component